MKLFRITLVLSIFLVLASLLRAQEILGEHIQSFNSEIQIQPSGEIQVKEIILYDFGNDQRHGIFRNIPTTKINKQGKKYRMDLNVESVADEYGKKYKFIESYADGEVQLKIGDPDSTISGKHTYIITYTVGGALTYFSDHDELYWNVTGNDWLVPIASSTSTIRLPQNSSEAITTIDCYTGNIGSTEMNCTKNIEGSQVVVNITGPLYATQGITIAATFPKNIVAVLEPKEVVPFFDTFLGKIVLVLLAIISLIWYVLYPIYLPLKWYISGRDPLSYFGKAQALFDPPKTKEGRFLTPAETGTLIDEHAGPKEIAALLVDLARRGFYKIIEKNKNDFYLEKGKEYSHNSTLRNFEKTLLNDLFASKTSVRLKTAELYDTVRDIQEELYKGLVKEGFFPENPDKVRKFYTGIAAVAAITFNFLLLLMASIFGRLMPKKTMEGVHAANITRSLKNFLTSQERQLEFQAKNQMMFEKLLPFAVAFGVEKIWADRFSDMNLKQPDWYVSSQQGVFTPTTFTRSLNSSFSSFNSAATPTTSSSGFSSGGGGGGSSGGGGGGGGGGSW